MRLFVIALLMVLLPIRGWMGDAMAISMITAPHAATLSPVAAHHAVMDASSLHEHDHSATDNRDECAGLALDARDDVHTPAAADCGSPVAVGCESCSACQVCNTLALATDARSIALPRPKVAPVGELPHFASIEPQPGLKPPIS